jgi:hypothetical protein
MQEPSILILMANLGLYQTRSKIHFLRHVFLESIIFRRCQVRQLADADRSFGSENLSASIDLTAFYFINYCITNLLMTTFLAFSNLRLVAVIKSILPAFSS